MIFFKFGGLGVRREKDEGGNARETMGDRQTNIVDTKINTPW